MEDSASNPGWRRGAFIIASAMLGSTLLVYFPFRHDLSAIYRYWDGPLYAYVAKTLYSIPADHPFRAYDLPQFYFASHLPLFPLLIRVLSWITFGDYPFAMLLATLLSSVTAAVLFYRLLTAWQLVASPMWTALLFCFFPPRWLLYHSVGATEPLFFCLIFAAFLAYKAQKTSLVILLILLASVTRIQGLLLIPAFGLIYLWRKQWRNVLLLPLSLMGILCVFAFYEYRFGDFFVYFKWNAGQHRIVDPHPFSLFQFYATQQNWHSTELFLWTYVLFAAGILGLWKHRELFFFSAIFFLLPICVTHLDLSRYILPLAPFSILIGFDSIWSRKPCRFVLPLLVYLDYSYVWGCIPWNAASAEVYGKLLEFLAN